MSAQIHPLERSIEQARIWIKDVAEHVNISELEAYHALRCVLHTLRDTLPPGEATDLPDQLPHFIRGVYYEGYSPARTPQSRRHAYDFVGEVRAQLTAANQEVDPRDATRAVFAVLAERLSDGQAQHVKEALHAEVQEIWDSAVAPV